MSTSTNSSGLVLPSPVHLNLRTSKQDDISMHPVSLKPTAGQVAGSTDGRTDAPSNSTTGVLDSLPNLSTEVRVRTKATIPGAGLSAMESSATPEALVLDPAALKRTQRKGFTQMAALCWMMFLIGWNDSTPGPLLKRIQDVYHVNYTIVSLTFVANCVGIIIGGFANIYLADRLNFGTIVTAASALSIIGFAIQTPAPPFPIFVVAQGIIGFSMTLQDIHSNSYVAHMQKSSSRLGLLHCIYGVGAFAAPLAATSFAHLPRWSFIYLITVGIAALNVAILSFIFRFRSMEESLLDMGEPPVIEESQDSGSGNKYSQLIRLRMLHILAFFILAYVGVEVTIGGWIVTYTIDVRGGGESAGYISSGFFGGLALGRVLLLKVTKKLGNRVAVFCYVVLAIGLEFIVWWVPSLVSGGVAIGLAGLFLGPIYPIVIHQAGVLFPRTLLNGAISVLAAAGTAGSAGVPFIAGLLAQDKGIWTLQPLLVSLMGAMTAMWIVIPKARSRID